MGIVNMMKTIRSIVGEPCKLDLHYDGVEYWLEILIGPEPIMLHELDELTNKLAAKFNLSRRDFYIGGPVPEDFALMIGFLLPYTARLTKFDVDDLSKLPEFTIIVDYLRKLRKWDIRAKFIFLERYIRDIFPEPDIEFTIESNSKQYTVSIDHHNRLFRGMAKWFRDNPRLKPGTTVILRAFYGQRSGYQLIIPKGVEK